jgi:hypothetical protein
LGADFFHADGEADKKDEATSSFSQFRERAYKPTLNTQNMRVVDRVFLSGGRTYDNFQWTFESASDAGNFLTV